MGETMKSEAKRKDSEKRRLEAYRLPRKGVSQAEVSRRMGVAALTVSGWAKRLELGGLPVLKKRGAWGRPRGISEAQQPELPL